MEENKCRVFVGIPVPIFIYEHLKKCLEFSDNLFSHGHWILPENAHITIRFFGDIDRDRLPDLWNNIQSKIKNQITAFTVLVEKIAPFPQHNSDLIAAYIRENDTIKKLFSLMNEIKLDVIYSDKKTFIPHITLFRGKDNIPITLSTIAVTHCEINLDTLVLYESVLIDEKRIYRELYSENLSFQPNPG